MRRVRMILLATGAALVLVPAAAEAKWTLQTLPANVARTRLLTAVSCVTATDCKAVGYTPQSPGQTVAERWNGRAWTVQSTPNPAGDSFLHGVSCTDSTFCMAVGGTNSSGQQPLAEMWDGTSWSDVPVPSPDSNATLSGISCVSATQCKAVGSSSDANGVTSPVAETWNGSAWTIDTIDTIAGPPQLQLAGVSCPKRNVCIAVGSYPDGSGGQSAAAERWNGSSWTVTSSPEPAGAATAHNTYVTAVSCSSRRACTAVGESGGAVLVDRWNGSGWSQQSTPAVAGPASPDLRGVSCPGARQCVATGLDGNHNALAERWNGSRWSIETAPVPSGATVSPLNAVSCVSQAACNAVGSQTIGAVQTSLAEHWESGNWSIQRAADPAVPSGAKLAGVACPARLFCVAVGTSEPGNTDELPLMESWTGTGWAIVPTPAPSGVNESGLSGVSCAATTACMAVGASLNEFGSGSLAESWDGTSWSVVPTPNPLPPPGNDSSNVSLAAVSCSSADACTAVGSANGSPLVERWDGTSWTIEATPGTAALTGVSCVSATNCTAVGGSEAGHWNGAGWSAQAIGTPDASALEGVSCPVTKRCDGVGYTESQANIDTTLAARRTGSGWSTQPTPNPSGAGSRLYAVSCASLTSCTAVGYGKGTLAEGWNGMTWSTRPTPNPGNAVAFAIPQLLGVSCTAGTPCVAVGDYANQNGVDTPLAEMNLRPRHARP